ncbi:saccharopine dehydrogenase family protein [Picosynechococcus sp. PCC 7117]|uniref:saccharopine dehydrogenase family protein n=1 Tax=Picosynechococcus sp. PCC 7117 TaxID=195498 RepID=UPI000810408E|nr:saccharopine dehydrogenase NADP-binding domain-containing protein [Picosynechococcus sp. PCC 7117]ANV87159.1 saccharopine dehydrogenase [Picosynechococcus sp. PCC 7117]
MVRKILILGGTGRIGQRVAAAIAPLGSVTVTGRSGRTAKALQGTFLRLDLEDLAALEKAIANHDLVIHCAGPFHRRDGRVLQTCIHQGKNYIDVSDHRCLYQKLKPLTQAATEAGIIAVCNAGVFPGISNSMVRLGVEQLDEPHKIELYYGVAGSGGAGETVLTTTFLGLGEPFLVFQGGTWQAKQPYSKPTIIDFPAPIGKTTVYWFDVAETFTFAESFPVETVVTKFGSLPNFYNQLTRAMTLLPESLRQHPRIIQGLSKIGYGMTKLTDSFTGVGVAMRAIVSGIKDATPQQVTVDFVHEHTAIAAGLGVVLVAELVLSEQINQPGLYPVEQIIPSDLFLAWARQHQLQLSWNIQPSEKN